MNLKNLKNSNLVKKIGCCLKNKVLQNMYLLDT